MGIRRRNLEALGLAATVALTGALSAWSSRALLGLEWGGVALLLVPPMIFVAFGAARGHYSRWEGPSVQPKSVDFASEAFGVARLLVLAIAAMLLTVAAARTFWQETRVLGAVLAVLALLLVAVLGRYLRETHT